MHDKRGKNYCVDIYWGKYEVVKLRLNTLVRISFIPAFHNSKHAFPPKREEVENVRGKDSDDLSLPENRINEFCSADIVFYPFDERAGEVLVLCEDYFGWGDFVRGEPKIVYCMSTERFRELKKQVPRSWYPIQLRRNGRNIVFFPRIDDIKDIEVYGFVHDKILEWKPLLPKWIVERLELDGLRSIFPDFSENF